MRSAALRQIVAAIALIVLTLSGVGRSMALANDLHPVPLFGVTIEICHAGGGGKSEPGAPARHDCCDVCALCAPVTLPDGTPFVAPGRVTHFAVHATALTWAPAVARVPTPRLSQGPPAA